VRLVVSSQLRSSTSIDLAIPWALGWTESRGLGLALLLVDDLSDVHVITCLEPPPISSNHSLINTIPLRGRLQRAKTDGTPSSNHSGF
jgi:hypothetical protein